MSSLNFCFFIPKYFSKCKCVCLNMFYHLPFRMRPQWGIYPKKPMWCSLWYAWDTVLWFGLKICFYFIRFHYICCVINESGQITLLEKDVKLWTFFVCVCVFLGCFNHPTMTQEFTYPSADWTRSLIRWLTGST